MQRSVSPNQARKMRLQRKKEERKKKKNRTEPHTLVYAQCYVISVSILLLLTTQSLQRPPLLFAQPPDCVQSSLHTHAKPCIENICFPLGHRLEQSVTFFRLLATELFHLVSVRRPSLGTADVVPGQHCQLVGGRCEDVVILVSAFACSTIETRGGVSMSI